MQGTHYTLEQRRQAVVAYQVLGNAAEIERQYGYPQTTLSAWQKEDWWHDLSAEVRSQVSDEIGAQITKSLRKSLNYLDDRIENGDTVMTKDGPVKIPVKCRDLAVTTAILFDKRQLLMNQPTSISSSSGLGDVAAKLMQAFKQVQGRTIEGQSRVVPDSNAV